MSSRRAALLARCTVSDRNCLSPATCLFAPWPAALRDPEWPRQFYSCDFCDTADAVVGRCRQCERRIGLTQCDCRIEQEGDEEDEKVQRRPTPRSAKASLATRRPLCQWCADGGTAAPTSCGRTSGQLRRVVFVLEPQQRGRWQFRVASRLAESVVEGVGAGTVLVYGIESGRCETEWLDAMAVVRRFVSDPLAHLPAGCTLADSLLRVSVVLATHSMHRVLDDENVRLELCDGESQPLISWWLRHFADNMLGVSSPLSIIDELYVISCSLFPKGAGSGVAAANARAFGALADRFGIAVTACDGEPPTYLQIAMVVSHIIASAAGPQRREPMLACNIRRFQAQGATLAIEPQPARVVVEAYHETAIDGLVGVLTRPVGGGGGGTAAVALCNRRPATKRAAAALCDDRIARLDAETTTALPDYHRVDARERIALLRCTDAESSRHAFVQSWPFGDGGAWTMPHYRQAFRCAAAARGLLAQPGAQHSALVKLITTSAKQRTIARQVAFLVERLGRDGVLDTAPGNGVQWSLERAIVTGLIEPPSMRFLWYELDAKLFDTSLAALSNAWARMEAPLRKRRR
jgi:hypothetical protein